MTAGTALSEAVAAMRLEAIGFLQRLVGAQLAGETAVQDLVAARLAGLGAEVERISYAPADVPMTGEFAAARAQASGTRASIVGTVPGTGAGKSLILFAHPDSEPVAAPENWRHAPFAGTIEDGRLYGWGIADDLAGVAAGVLALEALGRAGLAPGGTVHFASTPSKRHARGVAAIMHRGLRADGAVYLHPAESGLGLGEIKAFASGQIEFRVTVTGKAPPTTEPGHTAFSHLAINPVDKAFGLYAALRALDARRGARVAHPLLQRAVGRSTNLHVSNIGCGADGRFSRLNPVCTFGGALSFPPSERLDDVKAELAAALDEAVAADEWLRDHPPAVEWVSGVTGMEVSTDHPLYRTVSDAVLAVTGTAPVVNPMHTSSDIRNPVVQHAIATVGLGPLAGGLTQVGGTDEWVDVEDFLRTVEVTATIVARWTGAARRHV